MTSEEILTDTSKFLSYVLRHQPGDIGLALDSEGWADIADLITRSAAAGVSIDRALIGEVVATGDKKRFAISGDGLRIRALHGHSLASVEVSYGEAEPPEFLYHGTATRFVPAILGHGLSAMSRQFVHLSVDRKTAKEVGERYGKAVVLTVAAGEMHKCGFKFCRAESGVWLTEHVPAPFLSLPG